MAARQLEVGSKAHPYEDGHELTAGVEGVSPVAGRFSGGNAVTPHEKPVADRWGWVKRLWARFFESGSREPARETVRMPDGWHPPVI